MHTPSLSLLFKRPEGVQAPANPTEQSWKDRRVSHTKPPKEPETRLFLAKKPVCTPGNLTTLISRAKTGKTATIGGAIAAIIGAHHDRADIDTLGFTAPHTTQAVILIDTEQSPYDAWTCHSRAMARAGQTDDPPWLCHYALVGFDAAKLRTSLLQIIADAKATHQGIFTIILDGVADFVNSVNDEAECNAFVAHLHGLAVSENCPIIAVIHSNEGIKNGDDGRGHLGKQLTRKAESNLLLKKTGEITTITSEKQRKAPITEADGVAFQWSDEQGRHVSCAPGGANPGAKSGRPTTYDGQKMIQCVPGPDQKPMSANAIHRLVGEMPCGISARSFKDWVAKWLETGEIERHGSAQTGFTFKRRY